MTSVALLRGINVGGRKPIRMPALKVCFEQQGFESVVTYIQSGNVVFATGEREATAVAARIERALAGAFGFEVPIVLQSRTQLQRVVEEAPPEWSRGAGLRRNVAFLRPPLTAAKAIEDIEVREGVDAVSVGRGVLYLSTKMSALGRSRLNRIVTKAIYREMTIRTYDTCRRILELMR